VAALLEMWQSIGLKHVRIARVVAKETPRPLLVYSPPPTRKLGVYSCTGPIAVFYKRALKAAILG